MTSSLGSLHSLKINVSKVENYRYLLGAASNHVPDNREIIVVINGYQINFPFEVKMSEPNLDHSCSGMGCGCRCSIRFHLGPTSSHALHLSTKDSMNLSIIGQETLS